MFKIFAIFIVVIVPATAYSESCIEYRGITDGLRLLTLTAGGGSSGSDVFQSVGIPGNQNCNDYSTTYYTGDSGSYYVGHSCNECEFGYIKLYKNSDQCTNIGMYICEQTQIVCRTSYVCDAFWSDANVTGYIYRTCTETKEDCSEYTEYEYACATDYEGDASCSSIYSCSGCYAKTQSCIAGQYLSGNSCVACPDEYPNSAAGSDAITDCYSRTKSRAWTGSQTACSKPSGCASVSCDTCSIAACDYVAYSNSAGTGDGTIKSGCSSNSAACQKPVASVTADANHYVSGKTCPACPSAYPSSDGGSISDAYCYASKTNTGSQVSCSLGSANAQSYDCYSCEPGTCDWRDYKSATDDTPCTPENCYQQLKSYTCKPGYYPKDNECKLCTVGYYCDGSGQPEQCPKFTSGSEEQDGKSEAGSKSINDCYAPSNPKPLTATDDTGTYVCISDAYYKTGTN